jgi:hypothetical protein
VNDDDASDRMLAMERLYWKERCSALEHIVERKNPALAEWWHRQQKAILEKARQAHPKQAELIFLGAAMQQRVVRPPKTFRGQGRRAPKGAIEPILVLVLHEQICAQLSGAWKVRRRKPALSAEQLAWLRQLPGLKTVSAADWKIWEHYLMQEARDAKTVRTFAKRVILRWLHAVWNPKAGSASLRSVLSRERSRMRAGLRSLEGEPGSE